MPPINNTNIAKINEVELPVFQQEWWWSHDNHKGFRKVTVAQEDIVVGRLVYHESRKWIFFRAGLPPFWAHLSGPALSNGLTDHAARMVLDKLLAQLPRNRSLQFIDGPTSKHRDIIRDAFRRADFEHVIQPTYSQGPNTPGTLQKLSRRHRAHLKKARCELRIFDISAEDFITFYAANLKGVVRRSAEPLGAAHKILRAALQGPRPQARILAAQRMRDAAPIGSFIPLEAAIACVWDHERYYIWMLTRRRANRKTATRPHGDAVKLLILTAMDDAAQRGLVFDCDGATTPGARHLYGTIFRMPNLEQRDLFLRDTKPARFFKRHRTRFRNAIDSFCNRPVCAQADLAICIILDRLNGFGMLLDVGQ